MNCGDSEKESHQPLVTRYLSSADQLGRLPEEKKEGSERGRARRAAAEIVSRGGEKGGTMQSQRNISLTTITNG